MTRLTIAIDGPAGAGKSTVAREVARRLNILYLDTGAMYRTCGLACAVKGLSQDDKAAIEALIRDIDLDIRFEHGEQRILLDGEFVGDAIRTPEAAVWASNVSCLPAVRIAMVELQRKIASNLDLVIDGRDIGTYVLPEARYKFFLTAEVTVRAKRRYAELEAKGIKTTCEAVLKDICYRDEQDSKRAFAPLKKADDAILIDSSTLDAKAVVERIVSEVLKSHSEESYSL